MRQTEVFSVVTWTVRILMSCRLFHSPHPRKAAAKLLLPKEAKLLLPTWDDTSHVGCWSDKTVAVGDDWQGWCHQPNLPVSDQTPTGYVGTGMIMDIFSCHTLITTATASQWRIIHGAHDAHIRPGPIRMGFKKLGKNEKKQERFLSACFILHFEAI